MKLIFAGTPSVAVPSLEALSVSKHEIVSVLTREDALVGRKRVLTPSAVASTASRMELPVIKANSLSDEVRVRLRNLQPDLGVVVAFGGLLSPEVLSIPRLGWINLHFSALPQWRGAAPVQWELISGATLAHTSIFQLVDELDAGDIYASDSTTIYPSETAGDLLKRLSVLGAEALTKVVDSLAAGSAMSSPQTGIPSYARKLTLEDGRLDPLRASTEVFNRYRGVSPEPGAWIALLGGVVKLSGISEVPDSPTLSAGSIEMKDRAVWLGTATTSLRLDKVQPAGRQEMNAADWFRGLKETDGLRADV